MWSLAKTEMTQTPISLLLLRRLTLARQNPKPPQLSYFLSLKPYSSTNARPTSSPDPPEPTSLSARMNFVFDQIDAIQRDRAEKDQTLQRIRDWRQSRTALQPRQSSETTLETSQSQSPEVKTSQNETLEPGSHLAETGPVELEVKKQVELVHPWPEWLELMERLVQQNYFDHKRKDEDRFVERLGLDMHSIGDDGDDDDADDFDGVDDVGIDFKDLKTVHAACVNFGKDRFDIMRSLSRQDIQVLVGYGCPSSDRKVVFSCKLLRKYAHLDEGDVCSNCSLRSSCEKAYLITNKEDEARTVDVMRVLLSYGFDPINGSVVNKSILKQKSVKTVVRKLLHQVVKLSAVPIDPNLPRPVIKKPPPKVKQPPPPPKKRVGRDDVEMKKGDWLCPKCDFMNFAKNTVCLQCDAKRPKRQLLPGEWECPQCNFLNYRRNMVCFHCDCKRPADEFFENKMEAEQYRHRADRTGLEKVSSHKEVSNAWNFDFDDNESDGADVSTFEYADPEARSEDSRLGGEAGEQNFSRHEDRFNAGSRRSRVHDREYPQPDHDRFGRGFDDFDDEDDVDSYEVDTQSNSLARRSARKNFSEVENSESEDVEDFDNNMGTRVQAGFSSYDKPSGRKHRKAAFSDFEDVMDPDFDENISAHTKWKSSKIAGARHKGRGRNPSFGSDEELDSFTEDAIDSRRKRDKWVPGRRDHQKNSYSEDSLFSGSESESDSIGSWGKKSGGNRMKQKRRSDNFRGHGDYESVRDSNVSSRSKMRDISSSSRGKNRGFQANDAAGRRMNNRDPWNNSKGPKEERFHKSFGRKSSEFNTDRGMDPGEFRNSRRVIER